MADLAIVVEDYGTMYRASTCLTLDQDVYKRQQLRLDMDWFSWLHIGSTQEESVLGGFIQPTDTPQECF